MSTSENSEDLSIQPASQNTEIEQTVSQRKLAANRSNSLRSTGPKSQRGKDIAARNSLKHGLLAKAAVITVGSAKESKAEFDELLSGLHDYFSPVGMAEELLVQEIAVCYWMERRAQLYEIAQISRESRINQPEPKWEPWKELGYNNGDEADWINEALDNDKGYMLLRRIEGVEYLINALAQLKTTLSDTYGTDSEPLVEMNRQQTIGNMIEPFAQSLGGFWEMVYNDESYNSGEVLKEIEKETRKLEQLKKMLQEKTPRSRRRLPDFSHIALMLAPEKLELVQRYTAAHEKRRYRALAQLERLQRQRSGERIPAPITVQVTSDAGDFAERSE